MKKKYLIVIANYYDDISKGLLDSALKLIPKSNIVKIIIISSKLGSIHSSLIKRYL